MHLHSQAAKDVSASSSSSWSKASASGSSIRLSKTITTKVKSIFTSPTSMAFIQTTKHSLLMKRKYVNPHSQDIVDLCICIASIIGALTIIIPYCINRRSRKLRHALILGLATSDLVSSLIITTTTSFLIANGNLTRATKFCTFAGFIFSSSIWTQHLWNLSIAGITYMILVHPLSPFVSNVERHLVWLWPAFWSIAFIANGITWRYIGFTNVDGYCTYNPRHGGEYFSTVFNFVPRALVVIVIIVLYTHLFFFLRRINLFSAVTSTDRSRRVSSLTTSNQGQMRNVSESSAPGRPVKGALGRSASKLFSQVRRTHSISTTPQQAPSINPPDSDITKRNGSSSTQGKASVVSPTLPHLNKVNNIQMIDGTTTPAEVSPKSRTLNEDESEFERQQQVQANDNSTASAQKPIGSSPYASLQRPNTATLSSRPAVPMLNMRRPLTAPESNNDSRSDIDLESLNDRSIQRRNELGVFDNLNGDVSSDDLFKPMAVRRDVRDFGMTSPPQEHLRHVSLSPVGVKLARKANSSPVQQAANVEEVQSSTLHFANEQGNASSDVPASVTYEDLLGPEWQWGMPVNQDGKLQQQQPIKGSENNEQRSTSGTADRRRSSRWTVWYPSRERGVGTNSYGSSTEENGVEAIGSTLNRQASVLLLLYPAVYVLLFSVSIIRIIVDISNQTNKTVDIRRNSDALHSIARWTIFAQGAIDALVFQLIERQFRRRMKRKRRIAAGEKVEDVWLIRMLKRLNSSEKKPKKQLTKEFK